MRSTASLLLVCCLAVASCAKGGAAGDAAEDAGVSLSDDAGSSSGGSPGVYDGGPPATIGGPYDATAPSDAGGRAETGADGSADDTDGGPGSCGSPSGSFTSSCTGCTVADDILSCSCTNDAKSSVTATLDLCTCPVTNIISNSNGVLSCCGIAGGSYTSSCTSCTTTNAILTCTCTTDAKGTQQTSLDLCSCSDATSISNTNGQLTCN